MFCDQCGAENRAEARFCRGCGSAFTAVEADNPLEAARALIAAGDLAQARDRLERALAETPSDRDIRLTLASVLLQSGLWDDGVRRLDELAADGDERPILAAYRGGALMGQGRLQEAKSVLDEAVRLAPDDFFVALKRGELFLRFGIYPTAAREFERALRAGPPDQSAQEVVSRLLTFARQKEKSGFVRRLTLGGADMIGRLGESTFRRLLSSARRASPATDVQ